MSWRRGGLATLIVLLLVVAGALILDADAGGEYAPIVERLESRGQEPLELIVSLGSSARVLILSDVRGRTTPKRLAAEAVGRLAGGPGLDAVVLAVPASEQPYIDAYLADPSISLLDRPAAIREEDGMPREFFGIYEAVRAANEGLPASRRVRVIAADVDGWPPAGATPRELGEAYAGRAEHMLTQMDRQLFSILPDARVLVFVDGYLALQGTHGQVELGGGEPIRIEWLGALLRRRSGQDARTVLVDAAPRTGTVQRVPSYQGTLLHRPLRRELDRSVGARVEGELAAVEDPIAALSTPGLTLTIHPPGYTFGEVAQGYIFLPSGR